MSIEDYLELLDRSARQLAPGKRGRKSDGIAPVLSRLGLESASWCELVSDFGKLFCAVAGRPEQVDALRSHLFHLDRRPFVAPFRTMVSDLIEKIGSWSMNVSKNH